jgi:phosphate/phosphite/phosphonate ABC transporter binding protein
MGSGTPLRIGNYQVLARLARGGMAEILLARQGGAAGFSRLVVLKRILPILADEPEFVHMFLEEARLAALVSHPNVVQIFEVGESGEGRSGATKGEGNHYIAMELIAGPSVSAICRLVRNRRRPLPVEVAVEIVTQACEGLHAAHELRDEEGRPLELVHRDVSPHNLMITEGGVVKLVDFGIAKARVSSVRTRTGTMKGKYPYMSPELCRGEAVDRRADLFALGATCHELLVGERLFQRPTELMIFKAITEDAIAAPSSRRPDVGPALDAAVLRALERQPARRFATAAEMGQALRSALAAQGLQGSPQALAAFLQAECPELLAARAQAVRAAARVDNRSGSVHSIVGFDDSGSALSKDRGASAPPRRSWSWRRWALIVLAVFVVSTGAGLGLRLLRRGSRPAGPPLLFGLPPAFPAEVANAELRPFLDYLEGRVGRRLELVVTDDYATLRTRLLEGELHLAILPHLQFVLARDQTRRLPVLAMETYEGSDSYQAYVMVSEPAIQKLEDLRGRRICYVDRGSASGYLIPRRHLRRQGLDPDQLFGGVRFSGNHTAALRDLIAGRCDAAAVSSGALFSAPSMGVPTSRLRVLAITGQCPFDVVAAAPSLPEPVQQSLRRALREFRPQRHIGRPIIGPTFRIDGFDDRKLPQLGEVEEAARAEGLIR